MSSISQGSQSSTGLRGWRKHRKYSADPLNICDQLKIIDWEWQIASWQKLTIYDYISQLTNGFSKRESQPKKGQEFSHNYNHYSLVFSRYDTLFFGRYDIVFQQLWFYFSVVMTRCDIIFDGFGVDTALFWVCDRTAIVILHVLATFSATLT